MDMLPLLWKTEYLIPPLQSEQGQRVPNEDMVEVSGELKRLKYEQIAQEGRRNGWRVRIWAVEIGCRGFPAVSMSTFLKDIGYRGGTKKKVIEIMSKIAEEASHSLWKASHYKKWGGKE